MGIVGAPVLSVFMLLVGHHENHDGIMVFRYSGIHVFMQTRPCHAIFVLLDEMLDGTRLMGLSSCVLYCAGCSGRSLSLFIGYAY
jgi:hypothetical protein